IAWRAPSVTRRRTAASPFGPTGAAPMATDNPTSDELKRLFIDETMLGRIRAGQSPVRRAVFLKPHGQARGTFTVEGGLPDALRVGLFAGHSYQAWVRFSSDTLPGIADAGTTLGMAIKLFHVPGPKLLP